MAGSMVRGIILSRHVLSFLSINGGRSAARKLHMLSAYWGFVLMGIHLGFHWSMMLGMAENALGKTSAIRTWFLLFVFIGHYLTKLIKLASRR